MSPHRGVAYSAMANYQKAIVDFTRCIKIEDELVVKPSHPIAFMNRAVAYSAIGQHQKAIVDYSAEIRIAPKGALVYLLRGNEYGIERQYLKQIADYDKAIELDSEHKYTQQIQSRRAAAQRNMSEHVQGGG